MLEKTYKLLKSMADFTTQDDPLFNTFLGAMVEVFEVKSDFNRLKKEVERLKPKLPQWTLAFQTYCSAGDDAECFCPSCDCCLDDYEWETKQFKYCPECGQRVFNRGEEKNTGGKK